MKPLKTLAIVLGAILGILFDTVWLTFAVVFLATLTVVAIPLVIISLTSTVAYFKIKGLK